MHGLRLIINIYVFIYNVALIIITLIYIMKTWPKRIPYKTYMYIAYIMYTEFYFTKHNRRDNDGYEYTLRVLKTLLDYLKSIHCQLFFKYSKKNYMAKPLLNSAHVKPHFDILSI